MLVAIGALLWTLRQPSPGTVRRTVITTLQKETPASFLVTGTLDLTAEVRVDSAVYLTPDWLTRTLQTTQPRLLSMVEGRARATVRVPGRVSYGFDVKRLTAEAIDVRKDGTVRVTLPSLRVHSVAPDLSRLEVGSGSEGWTQIFPSDAHADVRQSALASVEDAFRKQAQARLNGSTQPRVNTAKALAAMLRPGLEAAGVTPDAFTIRINESLVYTPPETRDEPPDLPSPADPPGDSSRVRSGAPQR